MFNEIHVLDVAELHFAKKMLNTQPNVITIIVYSHSGIYTQIQFYIDSLNLIILEVTPNPPWTFEWL